MKFENTEVMNFEGAIRGMRNPLESWDKSDSYFGFKKEVINYNITQKELLFLEEFELGKNDLDLMKKLVKAGSSHRKFMRQIFVSVDITAPLYWWKEFDTYKVGTVSNSCSTMHKLSTTPITRECFELDEEDDFGLALYLEQVRKKFLDTKDKKYWRKLIQLLPCSWLQKRTVTMTYENVLSMVEQRIHHKLKEWSVDFIGWAKSLPYAEELLFNE